MAHTTRATDLLKAAGDGKFTRVCVLMKRFPESNDMALCYAARGGHRPVVQQLLEGGHCTRDGQNCALEAAAAGDHLAVALQLMRKCKNLDYDDAIKSAQSSSMRTLLITSRDANQAAADLSDHLAQIKVK